MSRLRHASAVLLVCAFASTAHADPHKKSKAHAKHAKPAAAQTVDAPPPPAANEAPPPPSIPTDAGVPIVARDNDKPTTSLPAEHTPRLEMKVEPPAGRGVLLAILTSRPLRSVSIPETSKTMERIEAIDFIAGLAEEFNRNLVVEGPPRPHSGGPAVKPFMPTWRRASGPVSGPSISSAPVSGSMRGLSASRR